MGYRGRQNGKVGMLRPTDKLMDHWGQFVDWLPSCSLNPFSCLVCFISFKIFKGNPGCVLKVAALSSGDESRSPLVPGDPCWLPSASVSAFEVSIRLRPSRCGWWRLCGANWGAGSASKTWHLLTKKYYKVLHKVWNGLDLDASPALKFPIRIPGSVSRPELSWWNPTCRRSNKQIISNSASRILWCKMWYMWCSKFHSGRKNWISETGWAGADLYPSRCGQGALSLAGFLGLLLASSQLLIQAPFGQTVHTFFFLVLFPNGCRWCCANIWRMIYPPC